ncbi:MAG: DUF3862 domain-containing protein, partial [Desulfuromonadales bacterium]|nr:DUF3862 domain-containing protein [Desulfuromonadales bacterium]
MSKLYIAIVVLIFLLSGCNKVTKENYDKIKMGMSYNEVVQLIGTPEGCLEALGISSCAWENG